MRRLVVVGGGIAGLCAAWAASRLAGKVAGGLEVVVLERSDDVGGKVRSLATDGWLVEAGPGGFLDGGPELTRIIEACGLADTRLPARAASARRFIYRAGKAREIVPNPVGFARSGLLSPMGMLRLLGEPLVPARRDGGDESVWAFTARRLGAEVADRLILPMALGIFAGDARRLSLPAAFPRMAALERDYGSLIRALVARRGKTSTGRLTSFRDGLQSLPRALSRGAGITVRCGAEVRALVRDGGAWRVAVVGDREPIPANAVVLAGEPFAMATLLRPLAPDAAEDLDAIPCPPAAVVALGYGEEAWEKVPRGFGVLIARGEGFRALGNLWETHLFPGRSPDGHVLIRGMYGGSVDPEAGALPEEALLTLARAEVARLYGLTTAPRFERVIRWPRAIPQYELGHLERVGRIERAVAALPHLHIVGNGLHGIAFADAAASGERGGANAARGLAGPLA